MREEMWLTNRYSVGTAYTAMAQHGSNVVTQVVHDAYIGPKEVYVCQSDVPSPYSTKPLTYT